MKNRQPDRKTIEYQWSRSSTVWLVYCDIRLTNLLIESDVRIIIDFDVGGSTGLCMTVPQHLVLSRDDRI